MRPSIGTRQRVEASPGLRIDPKVVVASNLLQLTQQELEMAIETELNENPALERIEEEHEPLTDEAILSVVAPHELRPSSEDFEFFRSLPTEDAPPDWLDLTPSETSLWDHLRAQLIVSLPRRLRALGEYMVDCVNEKGYLGIPPEEIALNTESTLDEVDEVLAALQSCEPSGIGARDLQECLRLQLRAPETEEERLALRIVEDHLPEFVARNPKRIARRYRVQLEDVEDAFECILRLTPFPGEAFRPSGGPHAADRSSAVRPDLILTREVQGWRIDVRGSDPGLLTVNRMYRDRNEELQRMERAPKDEKRHLALYVQRARDFISGLEQRRHTLRQIGHYLVEHQAGFVSTGRYEFLQPLTRSRMALELALHESTISRATQSKFVQIETGEVVPFEVFFKPALRVQKMIEEILQTENPDQPLSDERIAEILSERGIQIARRTVNKYRDRTKLLSSRKRRVA